MLGLRSGEALRSVSAVRCSFAKCCVCDLDGGFMVLTVDNRWVHKRCGILLRNSIYNNIESYYSKTGITNMNKAMTRTLVQFVIPSPENLGMVSNEEYNCDVNCYNRIRGSLVNSRTLECQICKRKVGRFVKCSMNNCQHV